MDRGLYFTIKHIKDWINHIDKFWKLHPSATRMGSLRDIYEKDKSRGKYISSRKMWFCVLYCHPESDFFNLDHEEKINDLAGDLFPSSVKVDEMFESLEPCIKYIEKAILNESHTHLLAIKKKIRERTELYNSTEYTLQNADLLDRILKGSPALIRAMQEAEDIIKESAKDGSLKGGGELSLMESGDMF